MIPVNDLKRGYDLFREEYIAAAITTLDSGRYVLDAQVQKFENEFAASMNIKYCVGVDNGLNAIVLGIKALGIGSGDEVIVQSNTYIATCLGVSLNEAKVVFVEPDESFNMDMDEVEAQITPRTKAVLVTHLYGQASKMDTIKTLCDKYDIFLLEDCAQSHYAQFNGQYVGTFGDMGFFSFYPTKNLGGFGDGGAIVTDNSDIANKLRTLRNYGSEKKYHNVVKGYNSRLDELQASLLRVKLAHINELTVERQRIGERYNCEIVNPSVYKPVLTHNATHVYHLYVVRVNQRENFRNHMSQCGVATDIHYPIPPHRSEAYIDLGFGVGSFPIAENLANTVVSLPIFNGMSDDEACAVVKAVNSYKEI